MKNERHYKHETLWRQIVKNRTKYLFISPFFIIFMAFGLFPIVYSFYLSFQKWNGIGTMHFVGFQHFKFLLTHYEFWSTLINTVVIALMSIIPELVLALIISYLINLGFTKFKGFFRVTYFLPNVTAAVAIVIIFQALFREHYGLINYVLGLIGIDDVNWIHNPVGVKIVIAVMMIWKSLGYNVILYLAGLQQIPNDLYEAAKIDGANLMQTFLRITLPLLKPMILFTVIMGTISGFQIFTEPQLLAENGATPIHGSETALLYMYRQAFQHYNFGYGAAITWIVFVFIMIFSAINYYLVQRPDKNKD